jgi:signal transduction histidine kinase/ligand-binding sensor domain-containing protein
MRLLLPLAFFFTAAKGIAQPRIVNFNHLTIDNGLSQSVPTGILRDSKGFIWITTYGGINKFDGITCLKNEQIANGLNNTSLLSNPMEDKYGNIWLNSNRELIQYSYTKNIFTKFSISNTSQKQTNNSKECEIVFYDNNTIIIHNEVKKLLWEYNILSNTYRAIPYPNTVNPLKLIANKKSSAVTKGLAGVSQIKDSLIIYKLLLHNNNYNWEKQSFFIDAAISITNGIIDSRQVYWFATNKGLLKFQNNGLILFNNYKNNSVEKLRNLYIDTNHRIWLSSYNNGVYCFDMTTEKFTANYYHNTANSKSIAANYIWNITVDDKNILWACAFGMGVEYAELKEPAVLHHYTKEQAFLDKSDNYIRGIYKDDNNNYWCTTLKGGIIVLDSFFNAKQPPLNLKKYEGTALGVQNQKLYFGIEDFKMYDITKNILITTPFPAWHTVDNYIEQLFITKEQHVLLATKSGIWYYKKGNRYIDTLSGLYNNKNWIMYVFEDTDNNIYEGVSFGGLNIYKKENTGYRKICSNSEAFTVRSLYETKDKKIWIGTTNGLYTYDKHTNKINQAYSTSNGLANNIVYAVAEDETGALWISTNAGINKISRNGKIEMHLTKADGLQSLEFNTNTVCKTKTGNIIFGGTNGLNEIKTANFNFFNTPLNIVITNIKADSIINPFQFTNAVNKKLILGAGTNTFEISFLAIDVTSPQRHKLKYRLTGFEDDWIETGNGATVRYSKVPPGTYLFEIAGTEQSDNVIKSLSIKINKYWWQINLFRIAMLILIIGTIILLIKNYITAKIVRQKMASQKQQAIFEDRERIAKDLHDNISADISSINILSGVLKHKLKNNDDETNNIVTSIGNTAAAVLGDIKDTIWFIRPGHQNFSLITERLRQYAEPICADLNIGFYIHSMGNERLNSFSQLEKKNIFMLCKEALHNSIKHSQAKKISVLLQQESENLVIKIADDGIGIKLNAEKGNGLQNMKTRTENMNGTIEWINNNGTIVTIIIPLKKR